MSSKGTLQTGRLIPGACQDGLPGYSVSEPHSGEPRPTMPFYLRAVSREIINSNCGRLTFLILWDIFAVSAAVWVGFFLSPRYDFHQATTHPSLVGTALLSGIIFIIAALSAGLYERPIGEVFPSLFLKSIFATTAAWSAVLLCNYLVIFVPIGRWIVAISASALICFTFLGRIILRYLQKLTPITLIVVGDEEVCRTIRKSGEELHLPPLKVLPFPRCTGSLSRPLSAKRAVDSPAPEQEEISWIVIDGNCDAAILEQLSPYFSRGARVCDVSTFFESFHRKVPVELIDCNWLIGANISLVTMGNRAIKRVSDIVGAVAGLVITLPLWPLIAFAIKISGKGPVIYVQERVGRHGDVFKIFKFRTMTTEAESSGKAVWASRGDARVTTVGRFLRRTRLDELPQFLNVLLGHMSLVGPRPERPEFVRLLSRNIPHYQLRHLVRPGITGWAQISYGYAANIADSQEKLKYDLYYVKYGGLFLDLQIIVRTLGVLMKGSR